MESREARKGETVECPLFGKKMSTELELFGRKWKGLLDTGSEISIIPAQVLLQAKSDGFDIDSDVPEFSIDDSQRVYDASGNAMHFVTVVEVKLKECGTAGREVRAKAYVTKAGDEEIILGTNVLPQLGYQLVRVAGDDKAYETRDKVAQRQFDDGRKVPTVATVARRSYIAPGTVQWITLRGCASNADSLLNSNTERIFSGVVRSDAKGCVEVPVINRGSDPYVFREGEEVGNWSSESQDWTHARAHEIPTDIARIGDPLPQETRMSILQQCLTENRRGRAPEPFLWEVIQRYNDVFAVVDTELTQTTLVQHEIDTGNTPPIRQRTRPVPAGLRAEFKGIIQGLLDRGIIERSTSPWASPVVLVKKKDGTIRLCVDYRELNKHTKQDASPLPAPDVMLQSLQGKKWFTSMDLCSGYWQIALSEDAKEKSAFTTSEGLFQFTVLPFDLSTSPAEFQRLMDKVLGELKDTEVFVYIDDILVATETEERHMEVMSRVLQAVSPVGKTPAQVSTLDDIEEL
ncbi:hypothetical protein Q1695_012348 [Nippostrongylus brasiliensis]|nr:hypothetical protein Q1695_012348 [Nippostrongylus brasiliensis]